ncbi:hypothetical protein LPJ61_001138 [Coemansia biformis]|uniref:ArfGap-domain-containing protein n=1 Tax=Coemansia biformis TaxID=1286918 RepID=A0A9W8CZV6_9FUNG|nr:hypothetical protein LPJ61_001138 [Coemansia biformis]
MSCHELGLLDIGECPADSPRYRGNVRRFEEYSQALEGAVQGLAKTTKQAQAASADYGSKYAEVVRRVAQISQQSPMADSLVEQHLADYAGVVAEIERNRQMQSDQLQQILVRPLEELVDTGGLVSKVKAERRKVDALQGDYETQLSWLMGRKATEPVLEQQALEVEAAKSQYTSQMQHLSLDYNRLASVKKIELLESFLSLMYAQYAFYHQAFSSLRDFEPTMRKLGEHIAQLRHRAEDCISVVAPKVISPKHGAGGGRKGSLDDGGYMRVGQNDDDGAFDSVHSGADASGAAGACLVETPSSARAPGEAGLSAGRHSALPDVASPTPGHQRVASRAHRLSLASISLSPHGLFQMSGYLFLRSQFSLMASWQRRWFEIADGSLVHFQRDDEKDRESVPLHLCMVKRGATHDRRNVFELIAPNRSYILQAETADELNAWKACLRQAIEASLYSHTPTPTAFNAAPASLQRARSQPACDQLPAVAGGIEVCTSLSTQSDGRRSGTSTGPPSASATDVQAARMSKLRRPRGNGACVDCGMAAPEWAAINLGALMCIECSGIHRSLGVHISKVRSVKLDNWEPELMQIMQRLGNARVNRIYEAVAPASDEPTKPAAKSRPEARQPYLKIKYAERRFVVAADESSGGAVAKLLRAAGTADLPLALEALAQGAGANSVDVETGRTALMAAVDMGDFGMMELLFLWGANVNMRAKVTATAYVNDSPKTDSGDAQSGSRAQGTSGSGGTGASGGTALHLAVRLGNARVVWYLVRKGAQWDTPDAYGLLPLDIALEDSNVQVVMALRYAAFQRASGLPPGTLGLKRTRGGAATEPVDMLDMDDSFIRDWAIPPYSPHADDDRDHDNGHTDDVRASDGTVIAGRAEGNRASAEFTEFASSDTHAAGADGSTFEERPASSSSNQ